MFDASCDSPYNGEAHAVIRPLVELRSHIFSSLPPPLLEKYVGLCKKTKQRSMVIYLLS